LEYTQYEEHLPRMIDDPPDDLEKNLLQLQVVCEFICGDNENHGENYDVAVVLMRIASLGTTWVYGNYYCDHCWTGLLLREKKRGIEPISMMCMQNTDR
jgi:hypothetical protein